MSNSLASSAIDYTKLKTKLSPQIQEIISKKKIAGLSLALVDGDRIVWSEGFGVTAPNSEAKTTANTPFRVGSITKLFTSLSTLQLEEKGLIDIDQPLSAYLERFLMKSRFSDDDPITIRNVLTHHSGIPTDLYKGQWNKNRFSYLVEQLRNEYVSYPPEFVLSYSNIGYSLLGAMIEQVTDNSYEKAINHNIIHPLNMHNTGFHPSSLFFIPSKAFDQEKKIQRTLSMRDIPAMGLYSSANDLAKFIRLFTDRENAIHQAIVSDATISEMFEHQNKDVKLDFDDKIGLTWMLDQCGIVDAGKIAEHGGTTMYFSSQMMIAREYDMGVVVLANTQGSRPAVDKIAEFILKAALEIKHVEMEEQPPLIAENHPEDAVPNPSNVGGDYVTDLGLVSLDTIEQELCACSRKKVIDLVPLPDGWYNIQHENQTQESNKIKSKVSGLIVGNHQIIIVQNKDGRTHRFGSLMPEEGIPNEWKTRLGHYELVNPDEGFPIDLISLSEKDNRMYLSYRMQRLSNQLIELPIAPISPYAAVTVGLGRTRGETIQIERYDPEVDEEHMLFSGLVARKIDDI